MTPRQIAETAKLYRAACIAEQALDYLRDDEALTDAEYEAVRRTSETIHGIGTRAFSALMEAGAA